MSNNPGGKGWVSLHRQLMDHWLWNDKPFSKGQAWIDLIMLANFEDKKMVYKGKMITCERGTVNMSILALSDRWGWDRKTVRRFLNVLESDGMITTNITKHRTTITLIKYGVFNDYVPTNEPTKGTTKSQQEGQQSPITNNITIKNNDNKVDMPYWKEGVSLYGNQPKQREDYKSFFE